jgi:hypothetical protein
MPAAGWEQGVMIPETGRDRDWLKANVVNFQKRTDSGEEEMELVKDVETRKSI